MGHVLVGLLPHDHAWNASALRTLDPVVSPHGNIPVHKALLCVAPLMEFKWRHEGSVANGTTCLSWVVASDCTVAAVLELYAVKLEHLWSPPGDGEPR